MASLPKKYASKKQFKIGLMDPMTPEKSVGANNFLAVVLTKNRELSSINKELPFTYKIYSPCQQFWYRMVNPKLNFSDIYPYYLLYS